MRALVIFAAAAALFGCDSRSYGTPPDCVAAGGQCSGPGGFGCTKEGPQDTCNCNPSCNPGGSICCLAYGDAGDASSDGRDAATAD